MAKYQDLQKLGSGGFGEVFSCRRAQDGKIFARKVLLVADAEAQLRFQREVRILSKLDHPRIIKVIGQRLKSPPLSYVMPLYKRSLMNEFPGIVGDKARISTIFGAVLEGMQYAHEQGVVHRDLKPGNILLNSDTDLVISDFGLGLQLDAETSRHTATGDRFGTPGYSAPEQSVDAKRADARADIFALGRILYELYTGDNPSAIQDLSKVPPGTALIIDRCTKTDVSKRFQSVAELRQAFNNLMAAADRKSTDGKLEQLVAKSLGQNGLDAQDITKLAQYIDRCKDDSDLLHELCVKLPASVMGGLWKHNDFLVRHLVKVFTDQVANQSWSFNYVDTLGDACVKIHDAIKDAQVRAMVLFAIVEVSVSHNRFRVMNQSIKLLMAGHDAAEDFAIAEALKAVAHRLRQFEDKLNKAKLGPQVAALLGKGP